MKLVKYILVCGVLLLLNNCTKDFESINSNPNAPIEVQPEFLLRQVIYNYGEQMSYEGFVAGNLLGQYFTAVDFNLFDRHSLSEPQFGGNPWPNIYKNLRDNEIILDRARSNAAFEIYEGPALILKAYMTAALTDIFGDVPYSEALKGKAGIITPSYDTQKDIYLAEDGILDNLRKAVILLENYEGSGSLEGDVLYNGDLDNWIRFANSLLIKSIMRMGFNVIGTEGLSVELADLLYAENYIMTEEQNATFDFTNSAPNNFRMATARVGDFNIYVMSETIDEILEDLNDPRVETFFRPAGNTGEYNGLLNGPDASQTSISVGDYSLAGRVFRENTGALKANFLTSWEMKFLVAEAAYKGYFFNNPKGHYENGVIEAFEYWNVDLPADYLTTGPAAYIENDDQSFEKIITQKWIANILNGFEGWIEYRRTGFPNLKAVAASLNNDLIPVRMPYPIDEEALNGVNFNRASEATDGNSINAPVWWDN